jgi:hypothetical protein
MQRVAIEVVNVDEDVAEKAVRKAIAALSVITELDLRTIVVEPHDEVRGVWASVDLPDPELSPSAFRQSTAAAVKALVNAQLYVNNKSNVHVTVTGNDKGDE